MPKLELSKLLSNYVSTQLQQNPLDQFNFRGLVDLNAFFDDLFEKFAWVINEVTQVFHQPTLDLIGFWECIHVVFSGILLYLGAIIGLLLKTAFSSIWWFFVYFTIILVIAINASIFIPKFVIKARKINPVLFVQDTVQKITKTILKENTTLEKWEHYASLYFVFVFIIVANLFGLGPFAFTLTSSFIVTFFIAGANYIGININGGYKKMWKFFALFLPSGVPIVIAPFLVIIEIVSYIAKVFSLSIRLFANMMSGHALLKILIGFSWSMLCAGGIMVLLSLLPWSIVTAIYFLELLIAFLQGYVFAILLTIYLNDVFSTH